MNLQTACKELSELLPERYIFIDYGGGLWEFEDRRQGRKIASHFTHVEFHAWGVIGPLAEEYGVRKINADCSAPNIYRSELVTTEEGDEEPGLSSRLIPLPCEHCGDTGRIHETLLEALIEAVLQKVREGKKNGQ